jgi:hypothetical protein
VKASDLRTGRGKESRQRTHFDGAEFTLLQSSPRDGSAFVHSRHDLWPESAKASRNLRPPAKSTTFVVHACNAHNDSGGDIPKHSRSRFQTGSPDRTVSACPLCPERRGTIGSGEPAQRASMLVGGRSCGRRPPPRMVFLVSPHCTLCNMNPDSLKVGLR